MKEVEEFAREGGKSKLVFFLQADSQEAEDGAAAKPRIFLVDPQESVLVDRCIFFLKRKSDSINADTFEEDVMVGDFCTPLLDSISLLLSEVHSPILHEKSYDWKGIGKETVYTCLSCVDQLMNQVNEEMSTMYGGVSLEPVEDWIMEDPRAAEGLYNKMALDDEVLGYMELVLEQWCIQVHTVLHENEINRVMSLGPRSETTWWRKRSTKLFKIMEQLKGSQAKLVLGVCTAAKSKGVKRWRQLDEQMTDAMNDAKDNVRLLSDIDLLLEPFYSGDLSQVKLALPDLFARLKMICSVSKYYNTRRRSTRLLFKVGHQLIQISRKTLHDGGKILELEPDKALESVRTALELCRRYEEHVGNLRERLLSQKGKSLNIKNEDVMEEVAQFITRLEAVEVILETIHQFSTLKRAPIDGLDVIKLAFDEVLALLRSKPYDILDHSVTKFEEDFHEFQERISAIEVSIRDFIEVSFDEIPSIESALDLLSKLESILQRDSFKVHLEDKYNLIFYHYGQKLESIQEMYDKLKSNPPHLRNVPTVPGNVLWVRHLLYMVEDPMKRFKCSKVIMTAPESKKIIRLFNRVAKTLIEYETLWLQAWFKSIEQSKIGLQATLLVQHPVDSRLCVNFDPAVTQLIREGKILRRLGIKLPTSALNILQQESKFKSYYDSLNNFLSEYYKFLNRIPKSVQPLLESHLQEMELVIRPGLVSLTWQSMNIDGYLVRMHSLLLKLSVLLQGVSDVLDLRVAKNLSFIRNMSLIRFPEEGKFSIDEFITLQKQELQKYASFLQGKRSEVLESLHEVIDKIRHFSSEFGNEWTILPDRIEDFMQFHCNSFYHSILCSVRRSFNDIKRRLGSRVHASFLFLERPFFNLDVELSIPSIVAQPSLSIVQDAINETGRLVLRATKSLKVIASSSSNNKSETYYDRIAADRVIVQSVLLLAGSVEGSRRTVLEYLQGFQRFQFLWVEDKLAAYSSFVKSKPDLFHYEEQFMKFSRIEADIKAIAPMHNIGCISLRTQSLKYSLIAETLAWKSMFARKLHAKAKEEMDSLVSFINTNVEWLSKEVSTIEDVGMSLQWLRDLQSKESDIEQQIVPIENMYNILTKHEVRIPKEEAETLMNLRKMWDRAIEMGHERSSRLSSLQAGFRREIVKSVKSFSLEVIQFCNDYDMNGPMLAGLANAEAMERLKKYQVLYSEKEARMRSLQEREEMFGLNVTFYKDLDRVRQEIELFNSLYTLNARVEEHISHFSESLWNEVQGQIPFLESSLESFAHELESLPAILRDWSAYKSLRSTIRDTLAAVPVLSLLSHRAIQRRHWVQIMNTGGQQVSLWNLDPGSMKLKQILNLNLTSIQGDIDDICESAKKEQEMEDKVSSLSEQWNDRQLLFSDYNGGKSSILDPHGITELMETLDVSINDLLAISGSKTAEAISEDIETWLAKLSEVSEVMEMWNHAQSMWIHMEPIFSDGNISLELPNDAKRFAKIDLNYSRLMSRALHNRNVVNSCTSDHQIKSLLPHLTEQLEQCQKSLVNFLERKRDAFPRFFFVSDNILLTLLSEQESSSSLEQNLSTMFCGIRGFVSEGSESGGREITGVISRNVSDEESVLLSNPVSHNSKFELLLRDVLSETQVSLRQAVHSAIKKGVAYVLSDLLDNFQDQVCTLALHVHWTQDTIHALSRAKTEKNLMNAANKRNVNNVVELTKLLNSSLTSLLRVKVQNLLLLQLYLKTCFEEMFNLKVSSPDDFLFLRHVNVFFMSSDEALDVSIAGIRLRYGNEYLGLNNRVVVTPTTDRCFVSFCLCLSSLSCNHFVGAAGSGKKTTIREFARFCGRFFVFFNCSELVDISYMERCFKGVLKSGSYGCLLHIDKTLASVLSVSSQYLFDFLQTFRARQALSLEDSLAGAKKQPDAAMFFTSAVLPGGASLPHVLPSLQHHLRTFMAVSPDKQGILDVKLASLGVEEHLKLARKLNVLSDLFPCVINRVEYVPIISMRNLIAICNKVGKFKQEGLHRSDTISLLVAIKENVLSCLHTSDKMLVMGLLADLFPGQEVDVPYSQDLLQLKDGIVNHLTKEKMDKQPLWIEKILNIYDGISTRLGVVVIGQSGLGKTSMISTLAQVLSNQENPHKVAIQRMFSKSQDVSQMFGHFCPSTGKWLDGTFSFLWKRSTYQNGFNTWICLDGSIDDSWVEQLGSTLSGFQVLNLSNGDRIPAKVGTNLIFETDSLQNASPSFLSSTCVAYVSSSALPWRSVVNKWIEERNTDERTLLRSLFDRYLDQVLHFFKMQCSRTMVTFDNYVPLAITRYFDCACKYLDFRWDSSGEPFLEKVFIFCLCWAFGGVMEPGDRVKFGQFLHTMTDLLPTVPFGDTLFDFFPDDNRMDWEHWKTRVKEWNYQKLVLQELFVPSIETVRSDYLLKFLSTKKMNVLITGTPGCGKSTLMQRYLSSHDSDKFIWSYMSLCPSSTVESLLESLHFIIEKKQGRTYLPENGKACTVFVDDISLTPVDPWGEQKLCELLRQLMIDNGYYSHELPSEWRTLIGINYLAAMSHPAHTQKDISVRMKAQFVAMSLGSTSDTSVNQIYSRVLERVYKKRKARDELLAIAKKLPEMTSSLLQHVRSNLIVRNKNPLHTFNFHDMIAIFTGVLRCHPEDMESCNVLVRLWQHECERTLKDKLEDEHERDIVAAGVKSVLDTFSMSSHLKDGSTSGEHCLFGVLGNGKRSYCHVSDMEKLTEDVEMCMEANGFSRELFDDVINQMLRIARAIGIPRKSIMLVSLPGSGRKWISRLAARMLSSDVVEVDSTHNLEETILTCYKTAGLEAKPVTVIVEDAVFGDTMCSETLNQLLSHGRYPSRISRVELQNFSELIQKAIKNESHTLFSNRQLLRMLECRAWDNLHLVFCFDQYERLLKACNEVPAIPKSCYVDVFLPWKPETARQVAFSQLRDLQLDFQADPEVISAYVAGAHTLVLRKSKEYEKKVRRELHVGPGLFLSYLDTFKRIFRNQVQFMSKKMERTHGTLKKLRDAGFHVAELKSRLKDRSMELADAQAESAGMLQDISDIVKQAERMKATLMTAKNRLAEQSQMLQQEREGLQKDLDYATPFISEAFEAAKSIPPEEVKSLAGNKNPPFTTRLIFDTVLIALARPLRPVEVIDGKLYRDSYLYVADLLGDEQLLEKLVKTCESKINGETAELLMPYLENKEFRNASAKVSSNLLLLVSSWVQNLVRYYQTIDRSSVKKSRIASLEESVEVLGMQVKEIQSELDVVQEELDKFQDNFDDSLKNKQAVEKDESTLQQKLSISTSLLTNLQRERIQWMNDLEERKNEMKKLAGDCGIASAMMVYLGPFSKDARTEIMQSLSSWCHECEIEFSHELHVPKFFTTQNEISSWFLQGLPCDEFSIQNGILTWYCSKPPVLIDPQEQCVTWLRGKLDPLVVHGAAYEHSMHKIESSVVLGRELVIVGMEVDFPRSLLSLVQNLNAYKRTSETKCSLLGKEVDIHSNFRLFLVTNAKRAGFKPHMFDKGTVIDFSITFSGLEDQILNTVLREENATLYQEKFQLMRRINDLREKVDEMDEVLVEEISRLDGNLLDDQPFMQSLELKIATLHETEEELSAAEEQEADVTSKCDEYRSLATRGAHLYTAVSDMAEVNPSYVTNCSIFHQVFTSAFPERERIMSFDSRLSSLLQHSTDAVTSFFSGGYDSKHRMIFMLLVALKIALGEQEHAEPDYLLCLAGCGSSLEISLGPKKHAAWISDAAWLNCVFLSERIPKFQNLLESLHKSNSAWKGWYEKESPETDASVDPELDLLHRLLLVRAMREDRLWFACDLFVRQTVGASRSRGFTELNLEESVRYTSPRTPILLFTAKHEDSIDLATEFSRSKGRSLNVHAFGEEELGEAEGQIKQAASRSSWLLLHHCDSNQPLMRLVETFLLSSEGSWDPDFRLWLTVSERSRVPQELARISVKVSRDRPKSIRDSISLFRPSSLPLGPSSTEGSRRVWDTFKTRWLLCFAILQQRGKFSSSSWNSQLDLEATDWKYSSSVLEDFCSSFQDRYGLREMVMRMKELVEQHLVGSKQQDEVDRKVLATYLDRFLVENLSSQQVAELLQDPASSEVPFDHMLDLLPPSDAAAQFGLSSYHDQAYRVKLADQLMEGMKLLTTPAEEEQDVEEVEEVVRDIATNMLAKVPSPWNTEQVKLSTKGKFSRAAITIFFNQEIERMQRVLKLVRNTLQALLLSMSGTQQRNDRTRVLLNTLFEAMVPAEWLDVSWNVTSLGEWIANLMQRHDHLAKWMAKKSSNQYWLGGMFNPHGFLLAIKQEAVKKNLSAGWSLEDLSFDIQPASAASKRETHGQEQELSQGNAVILYGLFLEGASWSQRESGRLVDPPARTQLSDFPRLLLSVFREVSTSDPSADPSSHAGIRDTHGVIYMCPCYTGLRRSRESLLFMVPIYTEEPAMVARWTLRKVALVANKF
ncbi:hypothetical protein GUITHDRAFT_89621 [Guillardia theta CCMP2712]|uniref:AAA+ ATPase domain-containing protein n=5 Tax=Guillardia theta TaxID=55529 RepID=L1IP49_GUITC|nr:hypothetical protein GUITHDRAFT_89621 [Guillardia theta CCMP2712]EKX37595.1 hypothetical protein GUITHDRAFT_89621 [Guillardia theta CCMP2712]|eukprot:XP_005824575.1 hypothetical protein GUITHDRAFT_89621 [Guillardia theta CCMP2712]